MSIRKAEAIKLWTRAYGLCSYPSCGRELIFGAADPRLRGEMAHIIASSSNGPRGSGGLPSTDRDKYDNLILLCPNHHEEIDAEPDRYSADSLRSMKSTHESWISRQLARGSGWKENLSTLDYINVPRLLIDPASRGLIKDSDYTYLSHLTTLRDQGRYIALISVVAESVISSWTANALGLDAVEMGQDAVGARIAFSETFRTKNLSGSEKQRPGFELSGELDRDPHIYVKRDGKKVYLPLDPRWVTTSTAFVTLSSGIARLAGLGLLRAVGSDSAIVSPLAIGGPPFTGFALY
jgi:hypothetical protein